jgi:hypothetical protein
MKYVFGAALLAAPAHAPVRTDPHATIPAEILWPARMASAVLGSVHVLVLALASPVAAALMAVNSLHVRFTSEALLEALPGATSLLCVAAYAHAKKLGYRRPWLVVSAVALGLTAASKYLYCICGIAVVVDWALDWRQRKSVNHNHAGLRGWRRGIFLWGAIAIAVFFASNVYLWPNPAMRLANSLLFHRGNSSVAVNTTKYVAWQPLVWLAAPASLNTAAQGMPAVLDAATLVLAALGGVAMWRESGRDEANSRRVYAIWLALGLAFVLLYANKWPQYPLVIASPLCLAAETGVRRLLSVRQPVRAWFTSNAVGLAGAALAAVWALWLGGNWHAGDSAFRAATQVIRQNMRADEVALLVAANPAVEVAQLQPGSARWLFVNGVGTGVDVVDYAAASALLNQTAHGKRGVWLLTYQANLSDPAENLFTLLQRQAHLLSPAFTQNFSRTYTLTHFRFDDGYQPSPSAAAFATVQIDDRYGKAVGLRSLGCANLRKSSGGRLEISCLWQTQPFAALAWDTKVSVRLYDAAAKQITQTDPLIARSGFPITFFEGNFLGNYFLELPQGLAAGEYTVRVFAYGADGEYSPRVSLGVGIGK